MMMRMLFNRLAAATNFLIEKRKKKFPFSHPNWEKLFTTFTMNIFTRNPLKWKEKKNRLLSSNVSL